MTTPESLTCPVCGMTTYHPMDVRYGWCSKCSTYTTVTEAQVEYAAALEAATDDDTLSCGCITDPAHPRILRPCDDHTPAPIDFIEEG